MAARYATSKITSMDDIYAGTGLTLGFRGEALFSMACVSQQLIVATRTEEEDLATKLVFDRAGQLMNPHALEQFPRKVGTTVAVVHPFCALPARRADLMRRVKTERTKIFKLMEAYCIFNVGVCFQLIDIVAVGGGDVARTARGSHGSSNSAGRNREDTALNTSASSTKLEETVSSVLGPKFLQTVKPIQIALEPLLDRIYGENLYNWGVRGLISSATASLSSSDSSGNVIAATGRRQSKSSSGGNVRSVQYYSINGRVVDLPKVTALVRKLWTIHGCDSKTKKPSVILDFTLPNDAFDINLSPDKQTVLLTQEQELLALMEKKITETWSSQTNGVFRQKEVAGSQCGNADPVKGKHSLEDEDNEDENLDEGRREMHKRRFAFVNDLSQAKMQHDLAARRRFDSIDDRIEHKVSHEAPHEENDNEEEHPPKKRRFSVLGEADARNGDVMQTGRAALSIERVSDLERRQWTAIQSKFRRQEEDHFELNSTAPVTPQDASPLPRLANSRQPTLPKDPPVQESPMKSSSEPGRNGQKPMETSKEPPTLLNLRQFAFQPTGSNSDTVARRISSGSSFRSGEGCSLGSHGRTDADSADHTGEMYLSSASASPESPRSIRLPVREPTTALKTPPMAPSPSQMNSSLRLRSSYPEGAVLHARNEEVENKNESGALPETKSPASQAPRDTQRDFTEPRRIVWEGFRGTEAVCQSALRERLQMRRRKHEIDAIRRRVAAEATAQDNPRIAPSTFGKMQVIGQFNLGFILAICPGNNLWILDQHACDERIHYEQLLQNMKVQEQPLIKPLPIELSPAEEACVQDYMDIFQANGFRFAFDPDAPIRHRLSLTALPYSGAQEGRNSVQFGPSDVRSLCEMLMEGSSYDAGSGGTGTDGSGMHGNNAVRRLAGTSSTNLMTVKQGNDANRIVARLPKAIAMCASRACRSSIMIGTALSQREMETMVKTLPDLVDPFHCAHGRPNQHHLGSLLPVLYQDEKRAAKHYSDPTITVTPMTQDPVEDFGQYE